MKYEVPSEIIQLCNKIQESGFQCFLVGGCVRNLLMNLPVDDWDITTNATPDEIQNIFPDSFYDNSFGTVGVKFLNEKSNEKAEIPHDKKYAEITTFRTDGTYEDHRHPKDVVWGTTLEEDVARRDFTINAIALKIQNNEFETIDLVGGVEDLNNKVIRAVGDANTRFKDDSLRLLRAVRFSAQLGFSIEDKTLEAMINDSHLIKHVSFERISIELLKILKSDKAYDGIMLLDRIKILEFILPELLKGKGVSQVRPGRHHTSDVFTHNVLSMKECPSKDPIVKLAALLHDVGKPNVASVDKDGYVIFYNHEVEGARISKIISDRLRLSNKQKEKIYTLIRWHMFTVDENITDSAVRRFIRRVGVENVRDMIDLRIGDRLGGGTQTAESWRLINFKARLEQQLNPPFSINDMAIDGNDIMKELNIGPGRKVGEILKKLFEEVDEDLSKNNRDYLLERIKSID